jgi:anti-sigma-K factor RskA
MSATTDFIAELVRAANEVHKLSRLEKRRLVERAITTIHDLRSQVQRWPSSNVQDAVFHLQMAAIAPEQRDRNDEAAKAALLNAAAMIRNLHIVLETKTETRDR